MWCAAAAGLFFLALLSGTSSAASDQHSEKLVSCVACHGADGQSQIENVPSIGAQPPSYSLIQLFMFREKMRVAEPMNEATKTLTDADLQAIADALSALPPPRPTEDPADPARLERARAATEQNHCNVCHRRDYAGQQTVPRLAGQREDYLLKTLRDYKAGARRAYEPIMLEVLQPIDDAQLVEFAYYLSHLR
jgi:cytochrome c553